jgi:hypothetical protein
MIPLLGGCKMWLIIDDKRTLGCDIVVRTPWVGKQVLRSMVGLIEVLCIDHDLGVGESGYDVVKWALENNCLPAQVQIVSQNPVGAQNIQNLLGNVGYKTKDGINYHRS